MESGEAPLNLEFRYVSSWRRFGGLWFGCNAMDPGWCRSTPDSATLHPGYGLQAKLDEVLSCYCFKGTKFSLHIAALPIMVVNIA